MLLGIPRKSRTQISPTGLSPAPVRLSKRFDYPHHYHFASPVELATRSHNPAPATPTGLHGTRFRLIQFRSPLLPESLLFSLPVGTEMFHFPTFPPHALYIQAMVTRHARALAGFPHSDTLGSPFGYQLPEDYRRFLRPSSAPDAKASTVCS